VRRAKLSTPPGDELPYKLREVLDSVFWFHQDMFRKRVASRPYDVPTAIDVLGCGGFPRLVK
jgi:hypothetical protein